jgi:hypothetical protein
VAGEEGWVVDLFALCFVHALVLTTIAALIGEIELLSAFPTCDDCIWTRRPTLSIYSNDLVVGDNGVRIAAFWAFLLLLIQILFMFNFLLPFLYLLPVFLSFLVIFVSLSNSIGTDQKAKGDRISFGGEGGNELYERLPYLF